MAKVIESLDLNPGESITLRIAGSNELSVRIYVFDDGECFMVGPMNEARRVFRLARRGIVRAHGMEKRISELERSPKS